MPLGRRRIIRGKRQMLVATLAIGAVMALAACGGQAAPPSGNETGVPADWDALVAAAMAEGELTIYTAQADTDVKFIEGFEAAYPGIQVTAQRTPTGDLIAQFDQESAAGVASADVVYVGNFAWLTERGEQGVLAPVVVGPDADPAYQAHDGAMLIPVARAPYALAYNTDLVPEAPKSIEDVYNLAVETGVTIGIVDTRTSIGYTSQYQAWEDAYPGIWERISTLPTAVFASSTPLGQSLAAGEIGLAVPQLSSVIVPLVAEGAPVAVSNPTDGLVEGVDFSAGAVANAPHPNAAQLFLNWLMTDELQQWQVDEAAYVSYLIPKDGISHADIAVFDPAEWPAARADEFATWWHGFLD